MIRLEDTTGNLVQSAISAERHRLGATASGMVMTLLVLADEATQSDAAQAASFAAQEHPMRILVLVPRKGRSAPRLDAEISVGGDGGPGELAVLRMYGELANHPGSVVIPLLLTDTPVVAWWPHDAPPVPVETSIGVHAQRRITDAAASARPLAALATRQQGYVAGDTDLAWTRTTTWRSMLAAALDLPYDPITHVDVSAERSNPSAALLQAWLASCLDVPVELHRSRGPGITSVVLHTTGGPIELTRPDGRTGRLSRPNIESHAVPLPRRDIRDLIAEELSRLDPDDIYADALAAIELPTPAGRRRETDGE